MLKIWLILAPSAETLGNALVAHGRTAKDLEPRSRARHLPRRTNLRRRRWQWWWCCYACSGDPSDDGRRLRVYGADSDGGGLFLIVVRFCSCRRGRIGSFTRSSPCGRHRATSVSRPFRQQQRHHDHSCDGLVRESSHLCLCRLRGRPRPAVAASTRQVSTGEHARAAKTARRSRRRGSEKCRSCCWGEGRRRTERSGRPETGEHGRQDGREDERQRTVLSCSTHRSAAHLFFSSRFSLRLSSCRDLSPVLEAPI